MFGNKKRLPEIYPVEIADTQIDIEEARAARSRGEEAQATVSGQWSTLRSIASVVKARRELNHFGDEFQVTFTPRERRSQ